MPDRQQHVEAPIIKPNPDPSLLTTQALVREIATLEKLFTVRMDAMDKAVAVFHETVTKVPTDTDKQIGHLKALHEEKFKSVEARFSERDVRTDQAAAQVKIAVDAALQAQKEAAMAQNKANSDAIGKSEAATTKQIDGINAAIASNSKAFEDRINDLKARLDRGDGRGGGMASMWGFIVGAVGLVAAVISIVFALKK